LTRRFLTNFRTDSYSPMSSALIGQTELTEEAVKAIHEARQGAVSSGCRGRKGI